MLIYVNQFNLIGHNRDTAIFGSIAGWLKKLTKRHFTIEELKSGNEFDCGSRMLVRTYNATQMEPCLYSIMLSHPDSSERGRFWVTEIGVKVESNYTQVSILLETSDISTQVTAIPTTTRPLLVSFLASNGTMDTDTIGLNVRNVTNSTNDFKALSNEVERTDRNFPLVIVSSDEAGDELAESSRLQEQLLGLAQVIRVSNDADSWEMERILGRNYSAWGGAVNIIFPAKGRSICYNKLLLSRQLEEWQTNKLDPCKQILSLITHTTNGYNKKKHFKPTDVRAKRQRDQRIFLQERFKTLSDDAEYQTLAEQAFEQLEEQSSVIDNLKEEHTKQIGELEDMYLDLQLEKEAEENEKSKLQYAVEDLKYKLKQTTSGSEDVISLSPKDVIEAMSSKLTPELCLDIIKMYFPSRVVILESAIKSSRGSERFKQSHRLLNYLSKLVNEYLDALLDGANDSKAKGIFGNGVFSANESRTVEKNKDLKALRQFTYKRKTVDMFKHLKIGVAMNIEETIRVHFYVDLEDGVVVIGYCGEHLPVSTN